MADFRHLADTLAARSAAMNTVRVGLVGTLRNVFEVPDALAMMARLRVALEGDTRVELVDPCATLGYADGVARPGDNVAPVWKSLIEHEVDLLLGVPANYGWEGGLVQIARRVHGALDCPVVTYAPFDGDPRPDGTRPTDRTCGIFPMRQHLRQAWIHPGYIPMSNVGDPVFQQGLTNALRVAGAVKRVQNARMLQIGGDQPTFPAIVADNLGLFRWINVAVESEELDTLVGMIEEGTAQPPDWLNVAVEQVFAGVNVQEACAFDPDIPRKIVLMIYALMTLVENNGCNVLTVRCWSELLKRTRAMACVALGFMNGIGIPTACETDRYGALSLALLLGAALGEAYPLFADNTITRENGDILVWHCGPFGVHNCRHGCEMALRKGWILPDPGAGYLDSKCLELGDTVTLCRMTTNSSGEMMVYTHEAVVVDGPPTRGTHFYIRVEDWPAYERELMAANVVHHWAVVKGAYMHIGAEAARNLGLPCVVMNSGTGEVEQRLTCRAARELVTPA